MTRLRRAATLAPALLVSALLAAGCGAKPESTSSTNSEAPPPAATESPSPSPTPEATETETPSPTPTPAAKPKKGTLAVEADPTGQLAYTETKLTAKAGKTTIDFKNPSPTPHNVVIRQGEGEPLAETEIVSSKEVTTSVDLKAGTYEYYCSVPGHEQAGMKGTLTVK